VCRKCQQEKLLSEFRVDTRYRKKDRGAHLQPRTECKDCEKEYAKGRLIAHKTAPPKPDSCDLCSKTTDKLVMDHDHTTNKCRGWLCQSCNTGLGRFDDSIFKLQKAINYLNGSKIQDGTGSS